jgi:hypothetical protein
MTPKHVNQQEQINSQKLALNLPKAGVQPSGSTLA